MRYLPADEVTVLWYLARTDDADMRGQLESKIENGDLKKIARRVQEVWENHANDATERARAILKSEGI